MTGPEHFQEAERLIALARNVGADPIDGRPYAHDPAGTHIRHILDAAQVHATPWPMQRRGSPQSVDTLIWLIVPVLAS